MRLFVAFAVGAVTQTAFAQDELVEAGLSEVSVENFREGVRALEEERFVDAKGRFWRVHLTNRTHPQTLWGLGVAYEGDEQIEQAIEWYGECAHLLDACAYASARLSIDVGRYQDALDRLERLAAEQGESIEPRVHWALMEAHLGTGAALDALEFALAYAAQERRDELVAPEYTDSTKLLELVAAIRQEGLGEVPPWTSTGDERWSQVLELLGNLDGLGLDEQGLKALGEQRFQLEVEAAARRRFGGIEEVMASAAQELARTVRREIESGEWAAAKANLASLERLAPRSSEYWGLLGLHALQPTEDQDWVLAEQSFKTAHKLAPSNLEWGIELVDLLVDGYGGRRNEEALPVLADLVAHNAQPDLHLRYAELLASMGRYGAALMNFQRVEQRWPSSREAMLAARSIEALKRASPQEEAVGPVLFFANQSPALQEAQWHYHLSVVLQGRGRSQEALDEARRAVELQPDWTVGLNHLAGLLIESDPALAVELLDRSLVQAPEQLRVRIQRANVLNQQGRFAQALDELQAVVGDAPEYWFRIAEFQLQQGRIEDAQSALDNYFLNYDGSVFRLEAESTRAKLTPVAAQSAFWLLGLAIVLACVVGVLSWRRYQRRTGISLAQFLKQEPRSYHSLARILAGMRHEVLKHNTTLLPTVADALENGDRGPALDASGILIGGQGAEGVIDLWERYIGELEAIGRSHGVRLNLRYTDPQIAPMCRAFRELRGLAPQIHKGKSEVLVPRLREISRAVNEQGYRELGFLLHDVCVLSVDRPLLQAAWERVAREPGIVGRGLAPPLLECESSLQVRAFREDFEDILANLIRNSCDAVLVDRTVSEARVGVRVVEEMDPVTGLSWVAIRVLDNATRPFTNDMLTSRQIGRGIGLAMDLAKRSSGSLSVEAEEDWSKAVVLRLAVAEGRPV